MKVAKEIQTQYRIVEEDDQEEIEEAWDDVSGVQLDPKAVREARIEEVECIHTMDLYTKVPIAECRNKTGKAPISVRWIDINKGDAENPNYRSKLVAREINTHKREDLFAATPTSVTHPASICAFGNFPVSIASIAQPCILACKS